MIAKILFYARNLVNSYTEYNNETQEVGVSRIPKGGVLRSGKTEYSNYVFRNQLNYNNSFAEKHEISALAGIEISQYDTEGTVNPYVYGYNKEKNTSSVPPYGYGSNVDSFKNFLEIVQQLRVEIQVIVFVVTDMYPIILI